MKNVEPLHTLEHTTRSVARPGWRHPRLFIGLVVGLILIAVLHEVATTHTAYPTPVTTTCLQLLRNTDYTKTITFQPALQEMQALQFVDELVGGQPAVLVLVQDHSPQHRLDMYIYGCTPQKAQPHLKLLFQQRGLVQGTATITQAQTLSVGELDASLPSDASALLLPLQQNVFREYRWQQGAFVQTLFPGLYPVTSRSEAEALQDAANHGEPATPWNDPRATAEQMAQDLFLWPQREFHSTLQTQNQTTAQVLLVHEQPHLVVMVTLNRLIQPGSGGLWFVTSAQTTGISVDTTQLQMAFPSPLTVHGTTALLQGQMSMHLFDHTLTPLSIGQRATGIGTSTSPDTTVQPDGTYTSTIAYKNSITDQTGLLLLEDTPAKGSKASALLLLTHLLLG